MDWVIKDLTLKVRSDKRRVTIFINIVRGDKISKLNIIDDKKTEVLIIISRDEKTEVVKICLSHPVELLALPYPTSILFKPTSRRLW